MLYHLPRAALWKQQQAVAYIPDVPTERIERLPPRRRDPVMIVDDPCAGDRYVALVQLLALLVACVAIAGIARRLGLSRSAAVFGALAFATFTVVRCRRRLRSTTSSSPAFSDLRVLRDR